ncbi:MAG: hypothetical protein P1V20_14560 [Verrucomicrobiales bacterium]|nr:hypothetical protein [Verrucomicrobiales bacterium]
MTDLFTKTFDTSDFPPRWHCGNWSEPLGWTHIISDLAIFGAYGAIPIALTYFILQKKGEVPFAPIFWLFVSFILFCGITHLVEATIFWKPWYRFLAILKMCTAIVSWATVAALVPTIPKALAFPGLAAINKNLEAEVTEREAAEAKLKESYEDLQLFNRNALDREDRVIELKQEVNELLKELGRPGKYSVDRYSE